MDDQKNLEAQLLGDMTYDDPRKKAPAGAPDPRLAGASAPLLDDMGGASQRPQQPQSRYQRLTDEQIATLQQQRAAQGQPAYTPEEIEALQQEYIERQRLAEQQAAMAAQAAAQKAAAAALLQEEPETYTPQEKPKHEELRQVEASALLEEAPPEPERKPVFNAEDLEAAKKQAVKSAAANLDSGPKSEEEQKRARQQMEQLRQQQLADLATAGFPVSVILTVIGVIAGACMAFFSMRPYPEDFETNMFFSLADKFYLIGGIILIALAITIVLRVQQFKGFASFMFGLSAFLLLIPGAVLLFQKNGTEGWGFTVVLYLLAIIGSIAVTVVMSVSDKLNAYYARKEYMYD